MSIQELNNGKRPNNAIKEKMKKKKKQEETTAVEWLVMATNPTNFRSALCQVPLSFTFIGFLKELLAPSALNAYTHFSSGIFT